MAIASCSMHRRAMSSSSAFEYTLPVGLCGVFTTMARVLALKALRSSSASKDQSGGRSVENARVGVEVRKSLREVDRLVGAIQREVESRHLANDRFGEALRFQRESDRLSQGSPQSHGIASDFVGIFLVSGIGALQVKIGARAGKASRGPLEAALP